jgi:uncharacterized linocin/CFP29 family protein
MADEQVRINTPADLFAGKDVSVNEKGKISTAALRTNATLRNDEWKQIDDAIISVARDTLVGVGDLQAAGLTLNLGGLGVTETQYERQTDMTDADIDMDAETAGEEDRVTFDLVSLPVPVVHKNFRIGIRQLEASRTRGAALDVVNTEEATRKVADKLEDMLFNGDTTININGNSISGYTTHTNRNTVTGGDWGTIANIWANIQTAVLANEGDYFTGPYVLYVSTTQYGQMRAIYSDGTGQSAMERVMNSFPISAIKISDKLTDEAVLVQLERRTVDLAVGLDVTPVEWTTRGGMSFHFKIMAAMVPRLKADVNGRMGLAHISSI